MNWIKAKPLEGFSALHEGLLWNSFGLKMGKYSSLISFNAETALSYKSPPTVTIHSRTLDKPTRVPHVDFCIEQLTHWEMNLTSFRSFKDYIDHLNYKQRYNYFRTEKAFSNHGCLLTVIEGDWSEYAERAYYLYRNVAAKYMQIYDLGYFQTVAKLPSFKLICAWHGQILIGSLALIGEDSTIHSMLCGLDYLHSKKSFAYSKLHYEFIRQAIATGKYKVASAGVTADKAKKTLGFASKEAVIEISSKKFFLRTMLRLAHKILKVSINPHNEVCINIRWPKRRRS